MHAKYGYMKRWLWWQGSGLHDFVVIRKVWAIHIAALANIAILVNFTRIAFQIIREDGRYFGLVLARHVERIGYSQFAY